MHDDEIKAGKVLYSGFNPRAERADYALPYGQPALQGGEPEFEVLLSRRRLVYMGLGLVGIGAAYGAGAVFSGGSSNGAGGVGRAEEPSPAMRRFLANAHTLAKGPMSELLRFRRMYVGFVTEYGGDDPELWGGIEKLAEYARLDGTRAGVEIAEHMLAAFETNPPPPRLSRLRLQLQDFVQAWRRTHR